MMAPIIDNPKLYASKEIDFIRIFFRILIVFSVIVMLCLFLIPINYSVAFQNGEVVSRNPKVDYKAPFEVFPRQVFVQKGDQVRTGDTLLVIDNAGLVKEYSETQGDYVSLTQEDHSIDIDKLNADEKLDFLVRERKLNESQYEFKWSSNKNSLDVLKKKSDLLRQQEQLKYNELSRDTVLYQKDVISLVELNTAHVEYLSIQEDVMTAEDDIRTLNDEMNILENEFLLQNNSLEIQISDLTATAGRLEQQKLDVRSKLQSQVKSIDYMKSEIDKQYIVATSDGVVDNVFNENTSLTFIDKGESLLTISPVEEAFYARARIDEQHLKYLKVGQQANLKFDAYNYYQFGAVQGVLSFIPESKDLDGEFYILIDIPEKEGFDLRSGYAFNGEIILQKMRLGQFIFRRLFEKGDSKVGPEEKNASRDKEKQ